MQYIKSNIHVHMNISCQPTCHIRKNKTSHIDLHFGMSDSLEHEHVLGWWLLGGFLRIVLIRLLFAICLYVSSGGADTRGVRVCRQREVKL